MAELTASDILIKILSGNDGGHFSGHSAQSFSPAARLKIAQKAREETDRAILSAFFLKQEADENAKKVMERIFEAQEERLAEIEGTYNELIALKENYEGRLQERLAENSEPEEIIILELTYEQRSKEKEIAEKHAKNLKIVVEELRETLKDDNISDTQREQIKDAITAYEDAREEWQKTIKAHMDFLDDYPKQLAALKAAYDQKKTEINEKLTALGARFDESNTNSIVTAFKALPKDKQSQVLDEVQQLDEIQQNMNTLTQEATNAFNVLEENADNPLNNGFYHFESIAKSFEEKFSAVTQSLKETFSDAGEWLEDAKEGLSKLFESAEQSTEPQEEPSFIQGLQSTLTNFFNKGIEAQRIAPENKSIETQPIKTQEFNMGGTP